MKILWIDTETTGVDAGIDEILSISAFITDTITGEIGETFNAFMKPTDMALLTDSAVAIHGLTREKVATFEEPDLVCNRFVCWLQRNNPTRQYADKIEKYAFAGYNVRFDVDMLSRFFALHTRTKLVSLVSFMQFDVYAIVQMEWIKGNSPMGTLFRFMKKHNLGAICEALGVALTAHEAESDILATRQLALKFLA